MRLRAGVSVTSGDRRGGGYPARGGGFLIRTVTTVRLALSRFRHAGGRWACRGGGGGGGEGARGELASRAAALRAASGGNLAECFAAVLDPRRRRGIRHSLASVLVLCTAAVLSGCTGLEDVTAWVHAAPPGVLAAAGARRNALGILVAPHPDTVVRVLSALGARGVARQAGAYLAARAHPGPVTFPLAGPCPLPAIAVDGKAVRGAAGDDGLIPYLGSGHSSWRGR